MIFQLHRFSIYCQRTKTYLPVSAENNVKYKCKVERWLLKRWLRFHFYLFYSNFILWRTTRNHLRSRNFVVSAKIQNYGDNYEWSDLTQKKALDKRGAMGSDRTSERQSLIKRYIPKKLSQRLLNESRDLLFQ